MDFHDDFDKAVDKAIRKAIDEGKFDDLPGEGRPLPQEDDNPFADPESWAANRLLKSAGFSLPWIEERKEIEQEIVSARASLVRSWLWRRDTPARDLADEQWARAQDAFQQRAGEINSRILTYNLKVPAVEFQIARLDAGAEIARVAQM